ncbi:AI-2E family transporter [Neptunicoccus sediminis]|uniref:AI-2E family transporter n=1 Tax=Neptunicoccus sediminis TaxID=1892596 RepID=UPI0008460AD4|nr:AI-2E family transporter [Neptunicoccus sediminis]
MSDTTPEIATQPDTKPTLWLNGLRVPLYGIFIILLLQALVWASDFLIPVTTAFIGYLILNRPRRWLERSGVPPFISASLFVTVLTIVIGLFLIQISSPTAQFIEDLPWLIEQMKEQLSNSGGTLEAIKDATVAAGEIVADQEKETVEVEVVSDPGIVTAIFSMAPSFLSRILFALILLFFLIASGDLFLTKTIASIDAFAEKRRAVEVLHAIEDRLGYYLGGITLINIGLGVTVSIAMYFWGMPNVLVFGFLAFGLNFVPFLGGLMGAAIAGSVAFVSLESAWTALGVFATYATLTSIEGQLVTPLLISRRMQLNTTVVFLTVAFFAWIWSVMGMVVALPILIVIKIACDESRSLRVIGRFIGGADDDHATASPQD